MSRYRPYLKGVQEGWPASLGPLQGAENVLTATGLNNYIRCPLTATSLRFDDGTTTDYSVVFPELRSRNLVAGFAIVEQYIGADGRLAHDHILEMQAHGMEIMHHTKRHLTTTYLPIDEFLEETYYSLQRLRAAGYNIQTLVQPGSWRGELAFDDQDKMNSMRGRVIRQSYVAFEGYVGYSYPHPVPPSIYWGRNHISGDNMDFTSLKTAVDATIRNGGAAEVLFHSINIGKSGYISLEDFRSFLDYLVEKQSAGILRVVTPTGMNFCLRGDDINLLHDPGFELSSPAWRLNTGATIQHNGGRSGACCLVPYAGYVSQSILPLGARSFAHQVYAAAPSSSATARIVVRDDTNNVNIVDTGKITVTTEWTAISLVFGVRSDTKVVSIRHQVYDSTGDAQVKYDDALTIAL